MQDNKYTGQKRAFPFRTLEILIAALVLLLAVCEPFFSLPVMQSIPVVTTVEPGTSSRGSSSGELQYKIISNTTELMKEVKGLVVHPWLPALTASQVKPLFREVVLLIFVQSVGVPMIGIFRTQILVGIRCLLPLQRRLRHIVLSRKMFLYLQNSFNSPKIIQFIQRNLRQLWKLLLTGYSKTNASKIVNRCKKYLHKFLHPHHDSDDNHQHYGNTSSHEIAHIVESRTTNDIRR